MGSINSCKIMIDDYNAKKDLSMQIKMNLLKKARAIQNLKGYRQLMHMRIKYHFLFDLHVTRHARETESEKHIQNTLNKPCRVELVTSLNHDYRP